MRIQLVCMDFVPIHPLGLCIMDYGRKSTFSACICTTNPGMVWHDGYNRLKIVPKMISDYKLTLHHRLFLFNSTWCHHALTCLVMFVWPYIQGVCAKIYWQTGTVLVLCFICPHTMAHNGATIIKIPSRSCNQSCHLQTIFIFRSIVSIAS